MRAPDDLLALAQTLQKRALAAGADEAEAFVQEARSTTIDCQGTYATPTRSHGIGVSLRVGVGRRLGVAGAAGTQNQDKVVQHALERARTAPDHERFEGFVEPRKITEGPTQLPSELEDPDPKALEGIAQQLIDGLGAPQVDYRSCSVSASVNRFAVTNTTGVATWDQRGEQTVKVEARVERGTRAFSTFDVTAIGQERRFDPTDFSQRLIERSVDGLSPEPLDGTVGAVILRSSPAGQLARKFVSGLSGDLVLADQSALVDDLGESIASPAITVRDLDRPGGRAKARVDHEGVPTGSLSLVEDGVATSLIHDSLTARHAGVDPPGRGFRGNGWRGDVGPGTIHLEVEPGEDRFEDLIARADRAVVVNDPFQAVFTVDRASGDFSLVAPYATLVEDGEPVQTLPHTTVGGNVYELFANVEAVGSNPRLYPSGRFPAIYATGGISCAT